MIGAGIGVALFVIVAVTVARGEAEHAAGSERPSAPLDLDRLAATILYQLLLFGGISPDKALREIRRRAGLLGRVSGGSVVRRWGERSPRNTTPHQRALLLDHALHAASLPTA